MLDRGLQASVGTQSAEGVGNDYRKQTNRWFSLCASRMESWSIYSDYGRMAAWVFAN